MSQRIMIRVFRDARVQATVEGLPGARCTDEIPVLEELLAALTVESSYTPEFYESETNALQERAPARSVIDGKTDS